jgi:MYXO-CTERM domain-containing protein
MRRLVQLTPVVALIAFAAMPARRAHAQNCTPSRMFVVLDHSSSMNGAVTGTSSSKWAVARQAVETVATAYESKIELGLNVFPRPNQCSPGMTLVQPALNNATAIKNALPGAPPSVGNYTPMGQTIDVVANEPSLQDATHRPSILLITDGWQWCSDNDPPSFRQLPLEAVQRAAMKGIKVYVVGFGGGVDVATLNKMAVAAGTARPGCDPNGTTTASPNKCYYQADSLAQLNAALDAISIQVSAEICDGLDNDCDGQVDEDLARNCATACGGGTEQCVNGTWTGCNAPQPSTEICDGKDNDCDGTVDNGCGCTPGTTRACGTDVGACVKGTQTCDAHGEWSECVGLTSPMAETCNGVDDDCDGEIDNGPPSGLCPAGQVCDSGRCISVVDDSPPSADPGPPTGPVNEGGAPDDGCGCRIGGARSDGNALPALLVLSGLGLLVAARRRRRIG